MVSIWNLKHLKMFVYPNIKTFFFLIIMQYRLKKLKKKKNSKLLNTAKSINFFIQIWNSLYYYIINIYIWYIHNVFVCITIVIFITNITYKLLLHNLKSVCSLQIKTFITPKICNKQRAYSLGIFHYSDKIMVMDR